MPLYLARHLSKPAVFIPCSRHRSAAGSQLSVWLKILMIGASFYFDCLIRIPWFIVEKIILPNTPKFREDYPVYFNDGYNFYYLLAILCGKG